MTEIAQGAIAMIALTTPAWTCTELPLMSNDAEQGAKRLRSLLKLPPHADASAQSVSSERHDGWTCETLAMTMPSGAAARGIMTYPAELSSPAPAILYIHAHGGDYALGAAELTNGQAPTPGPARSCLRARRLRDPGHRPALLRHPRPRSGGGHCQEAGLVRPHTARRHGRGSGCRTRLAGSEAGKSTRTG